MDGNIGQMMEPAEFPPMREIPDEPPVWAVSGAKDRKSQYSLLHLYQP